MSSCSTDSLEQQADNIADQVATPSVGQVKPAQQSLRGEHVSAKKTPINTFLPALQGEGDVLPDTLRTEMESRIGHDFSEVRIHKDSHADEQAQQLSARAFTTGRDIVFAHGEYQPDSYRGKHLLAHELAHVVQQRQGAHRLQRKITAQQRQATRCNSKQYDTAQKDIKRALDYLITAVSKLRNAGSDKLVSQALKRYFKLEDNSKNDAIKTDLLYIYRILNLYAQSAFFRLASAADCKREGDTAAYVPREKSPAKPVVTGSGEKVPRTLYEAEKGQYSRPIFLCGDEYFGESSPQVRARIMIHEGAHLIGKSPTQRDDIYLDTPGFLIVNSNKLLTNADSYAHFATALATGNVSLQSPLKFGMGFGGGAILSSGTKPTVGWYVSVNFDAVSNKPILRYFYPFGQVSVNFIGTPSPDPNARRADKTQYSLVTGLLAGVRIKPVNKPGGVNWYLSLGGGLLLSYTEAENEEGGRKPFAVGATATIYGGFRWNYVGASLGASYLNLPNIPGFKHAYQLGGKLSFTFNW
ncbi:MAG: DUF4157 domain-containing protein [Thiohalophilus sp.]